MHTTQYTRLPTGTTLKRTFKSPNPALNVTRRNEPVACDIVYSDVPAIDDGSIATVIFVVTDTQVTDVYGIKSDKQSVNTLEDNITYRGAPHKLNSDSAQVIIGNKVQDILHTLCIMSWQSEPYQQQQNPAERRYQTIKCAANRVLDRTGAPSYTCLLCFEYLCFLLNHTYNDNIQGVPLQHLNGHNLRYQCPPSTSIFGRRFTTRRLMGNSLLILLKPLDTLLVSPIIVVMPLLIRSSTLPP